MKSGIAYLKYFSFQVEWKVFLITFSSINMNFSLPKLFDDDPTLFKKGLISINYFFDYRTPRT